MPTEDFMYAESSLIESLAVRVSRLGKHDRDQYRDDIRAIMSIAKSLLVIDKFIESQ